MRFVGVIDHEGQVPIKLALFGDVVDNAPKVDDVIRITNVYPYTRKKKQDGGPDIPLENSPSSLGMSRASTLEVTDYLIHI